VRLLVVASSGQPGGAELALDAYLAHLPADAEAQGLVLSPGPVAGSLAARLGRPVAVASLDGRPSARRAGAFGRSLVGALRRERPDVVFATGLKAATLCAAACRVAGVPLVWHKVDFSHDDAIARPLSLLCAGVVPVSEAVRATIPASRQLPVVPPPVRLHPGFRVGDARPPATIASIGRLVPYKGHADVIAAAGLLRDRFPDVRVVIAGATEDPGDPEELRTAARAAGLADRLELIGHVAEIEAVLERATVVVGATYREGRYGGEGFGAALAEAAWAGLPVVATRGGGAAEALVDGVSGRVVAPRDPAALASAVGDYLRDPALARSAGEAGARWARERLAPAPLSARLFAALRGVSAAASAPAPAPRAA
jgi:glycosyltransferase involved in cell wall biosynthesis